MDLREKVARAIYEGRNGAGCLAWGRRDNAHKAPYLRDADVALAVIREALAEPTPEMVKAYCRSLVAFVHAIQEPERSARFGLHSKHHGYRVPNDIKARVRYRAMLAASPIGGK